jgi:hypothetical protein
MPTDLSLVFGYVFAAVVVVTFEEEGGELAAPIASGLRIATAHPLTTHLVALAHFPYAQIV